MIGYITLDRWAETYPGQQRWNIVALCKFRIIHLGRRHAVRILAECF